MASPLRRALAILLLLTCAVAWHPTPAAAQDPPQSAQSAQEATPQSGAFLARPIPMGTSCGNWQSAPFIYAGTCGLLVRFFDAPSIMAILSNNHVLGAQGPTLCPSTATPLQTIALQPGTLDIGSIPPTPTANGVAVFVGAIPIDFTPGASNFVDAALAVTGPTLAKREIVSLGDPVQAITTPAPGMAVKKTGRTTDTTNGTISTINTTVNVNYGAGCSVARFVGQIVITPGAFSGGGDSGSAILESSSNIPVGLLFAGSATATIANDIRAVYVLARVFPDGVPPGGTSAGLTASAVRQSMARTGNAEIDRVSAIKARTEGVFFSNPDVMGVGVGRSDSGGAAIVVYTKASAEATARAVPAQIEGVPVRVVHTGEFSAYRW